MKYLNRKELISNALRGKRVAVIGDCMLDRYIAGSVNRMSPEAPVPVLLHEKTVDRPGGAANVALNVYQLESTPTLCSIIGNDQAGSEMKELLNAIGDDGRYLVISENRKTTVKTRLLGNNQHLLRLDTESESELDETEEQAVIGALDRLFLDVDPEIVILQDYNKGMLTTNVVNHVLDKCTENDIFIAVDPKFDHFFSYKDVNLFKPNLKEISQAVGQRITPAKENLDLVAEELTKQLNTTWLMITLSEHGVFISNSDGFSIIVPAEREEIVDVCGAGDAVLVVSALMLCGGLGVDLVGLVANIAGKVVCGKIGVAPVSLKEIIQDV